MTELEAKMKDTEQEMKKDVAMEVGTVALPAEDARKRADHNFRRLVIAGIAETMKRGNVEFYMEVTGASSEAIASIKKELEDLGYRLSEQRHALANQSRTAKILKVEF